MTVSLRKSWQSLWSTDPEWTLYRRALKHQLCRLLEDTPWESPVTCPVACAASVMRLTESSQTPAQDEIGGVIWTFPSGFPVAVSVSRFVHEIPCLFPDRCIRRHGWFALGTSTCSSRLNPLRGSAIYAKGAFWAHLQGFRLPSNIACWLATPLPGDPLAAPPAHMCSLTLKHKPLLVRSFGACEYDTTILAPIHLISWKEISACASSVYSLCRHWSCTYDQAQSEYYEL